MNPESFKDLLSQELLAQDPASRAVRGENNGQPPDRVLIPAQAFGGRNFRKEDLMALLTVQGELKRILFFTPQTQPERFLPTRLPSRQKKALPRVGGAVPPENLRL